jgi:hypothetical protein
MTFRTWRVAVAVVVLASAGPAAAQGLIWNLPEDGTEVVYGGTITQTDIRPGGAETELTWDNRLVVRSVGTQDVQYRGKTVPGRWIEFELATGKATEQGIDTGPVGARIYKVLVAESAVTGTAADERGIPRAFLPIIEGYLKMADQPPQKMASTAFEVFPTLSLLMVYKPNELTAEAEGQEAESPAGRFTATQYAAKATIESPSSRVENTATLIVSPDMAFGPVRWTATVVRSTKDPNQPRDAYIEASRVESQMEAKEINRNARSVLNVAGQ